jgi:alanine dehydrogenase
MSEVAGRLAAQKGAQYLEAINGGKGILMSGVSGVKPANVVVLGAGIAGTNACFGALGMEARVTVMDTNPAKLRHLHDITRGHISTLMSNSANIAEECAEADLVIGAALVPGSRTPQLISRELVAAMQKGSVIVDVAVDQGGCAETSRPTTHHAPTFTVDGVVHYCVANMPGAVPRTSTLALTNVTLRYGLELADRGAVAAQRENAALRRGFNVCRGKITHPAVAETFGMAYTPPEAALQ